MITSFRHLTNFVAVDGSFIFPVPKDDVGNCFIY